MEKRKTNESVKTGLQIESGNRPKRKRITKRVTNNTGTQLPANKEIDVDDVIHEPDFEPTAEFNKENSEVDNGDANK